MMTVTVPCLVRSVAEHSRLAVQFIENLHRQDLHPLEEAWAFHRLLTEFNLTQRDLAQRLGKSLSAINETLRLLELTPAVLSNVRTSEQISKSVLLEMAKAPDAATQRALLEQAQSGQMTVRQARIQKRDRPASATKATRWSLPLTDATVVIQFRHGEATPDRVKATLHPALACSERQA